MHALRGQGKQREDLSFLQSFPKLLAGCHSMPLQQPASKGGGARSGDEGEDDE